ncbi:His/Gly/Thr/Pro-type tRNA ligase C-terminal domain-containing protein [Candidatus Saccharibacteria bacterium]|nr:His/Gly/Thr/Pro-type tRNA ligase C-terminal domain-containing protein [Candidatus Saccharibacteria bacterium]
MKELEKLGGSMKRTEFWIKTSKSEQSEAEEPSRNARLLTKAGYVDRQMAGVYAYLPIGFRVLEKIKAIVREEMNAVGGSELIMSSLQPRDLWESTGRWDDEVVDVWFKSQLKDESPVGLAWSHEEPILETIGRQASSYRDLPISVYQFQTKLRNELRAKSGVLRGREFIMKDMYSMHASEQDLADYYERVKQAYVKIYERLGLGNDTFITFASGGAFTKFSHEFQTLCDAGEDWLYLDRAKNIAVNEEVLDEAVKEFNLDKSKLEKVKSAEVGNIFNFGDEKAKDMQVEFIDEAGNKKPLYLGSYGIGITRVMGVLAEKFSDDQGLVWPAAVAPFSVYLIGIGEAGEHAAAELYTKFVQAGIEILWDDRDAKLARVGEKLADSELLGISYRVVVSDKTLEQGKVEFKPRTGEAELLTSGEVLARLSAD